MSLINAESMDIENMKVIDLRKHLKSLGLLTTGNKSELVDRLQDALLAKESSEDMEEESVLHDTFDDSTKDDDLLEDELSSSSPEKDKIDIDQSANKEENSVLTTMTVPFKKRAVIEAVPRITSASQLSFSSITSAEPPISQEEKPFAIITPNQFDNSQNPSASIKSPKKIVIIKNTFLIENETPAPTKNVQHTKIQFENETKKNGDSIPVASKKISDDEKISLRAKRFNITKDSPIKSSLTPIENKSTPISSTNVSAASNLELMRKRAARFGGSVSNVMKELEDKEKISKRKEKYGSVNIKGSAAVGLEDKEKILKRKLKFGEVTAAAGSASDQEKKKKRMERFGL